MGGDFSSYTIDVIILFFLRLCLVLGEFEKQHEGKKMERLCLIFEKFEEKYERKKIEKKCERK